ncbi:uncharacterized protein [Dysidea avara]|uniref:uncharacterized protein isoform X2 n=1 Tax=Dysidea avara TaxID=196820 RepID=UPI00332CDC52
MKIISALVISFMILSRCTDAAVMTKVILTDAPSKGAVCLDGSPPGYYIHNGTSSPNKWIIHLQGGGWCGSERNCVDRSKRRLGSSKDWPPKINYSGLLSDDCTINPNFCGWSMVFVGYCDGASFAGYVEDPIKWNGSILYFRGAKILEVVMDAILAAGGDKIEHVILTGCSAGGLATYLHADYVRSKVSSHIPVHAIADAGYFLDAPNVNGEMYIRGLFQYVFNMQKCKNAVNQDCITANPTEEWKCFMAQYTYPHIKTPIFLLNARYDTYQIGNILGLNCYPPNCTADQMKEFENYGNEFLNAAAPAISSTSNGVYIDSCQIHCQSLTPTPWSKFIVGGQTMRDTFNAWLTNSTATKSKVVDCTYPCNPTCS